MIKIEDWPDWHMLILSVNLFCIRVYKVRLHIKAASDVK